MGPPPSDLVFIILQFMYKCNWFEAAQNLEQESKVYFNLEAFTVMLKNGLWEKVHKYLSSFTHPGECYNSKMIFSKIGREKYLEALDQKDRVKALSVFDKDLKALLTPEHARELVELIPLDNFREKAKFAKYGDTKTMRTQLVVELVDMLKENPMIKGKLSFPQIDSSRLETLAFQSVQWQHLICNIPGPNPADMGSLYTDVQRSPSLTPHQNVEDQLRLRNPYRNSQNQGAGPSSAQHSSGPSVNRSNSRRRP